MFSIIIPLYNKAAYIEKAIWSVLNQSIKDFELIIVDDGSTDDGMDIVVALISSIDFEVNSIGIRILSQENRGVSAARNLGVRNCKNSYIAFLDADDWWEPSFLREMRQLIIEYPEAGIYGSSYFKYKNGQGLPASIGVRNGFEKGLINYCQVYTKGLYMPLWTGATIIRKSVFEVEDGFKPQLIVGEDFDLWLRIALNHPVALLNKPLAYYNQDVEQAQRAVVFNKLYKPENHFIFNLEYLSSEERTNPDLKALLDMLRVYTLERYRLQNAYPKEYKREIDKVDFSRQPLMTKVKYILPRILLWKWEEFKIQIIAYFRETR